jgi:hypothetical protein
MSLEGLNDGNYSIVTADSKVVPLSNVVGKYNS